MQQIALSSPVRGLIQLALFTAFSLPSPLHAQDPGATAPLSDPAAFSDAAPSADLLELVSRLEHALGGAAALENSGDIELTGTLESAGVRFHWRGLFRRRPFAFREEMTSVVGQSEQTRALHEAQGGPSPGQTAVFVSDGRRVRRVDLDGQPEQHLEGPGAWAALDSAALFHLLLAPREMLLGARMARVMPPARAPAWAQDEGAATATHRVGLVLPHGTSWVCHVDAQTGLPLGVDDGMPAPAFGERLDEWTQHGNLQLPALRLGAPRNGAPTRLEILDVRSGLTLPDELFGTDPLLPQASRQDAAELLVVHSPVPGAAYLTLPQGRIQHRGPFMTMLDTGAGDLYSDRRLLASLGLPVVAGQRTRSIAGVMLTHVHVADLVELGGLALPQVTVTGTSLPAVHELPSETPVRLIVGGPRLMELAPVLDLRARQLAVRQRPATPLAELTGRETLLWPLRFDDRERPFVEVTIPPGFLPGLLPDDGAALVTPSETGGTFHALLDTGLPHVLRLSVGTLRALGLPEDAESWRRAGAVRWNLTGAGGGSGSDLLVRLPEIRIGSVRWREPWVLLAGLGDVASPGSPDDVPSLVGAGALLAFEQVAFDPDRRTVEILLPETADDPSVFVVPPAPAFLGVILRPPHASDSGHPHDLPHVLEVVPGTPADAAGLMEGDFLAAIQGVSCRGMAPYELFREGDGLLRLPDEGALELTVLRAGDDGRLDELQLELRALDGR